MIIIQMLANGILQQMVQPIAYGAALGIHPLAALVATIGGGCLFGAIGLILGRADGLGSRRISSDLANAGRAVGATGTDPRAPAPKKRPMRPILSSVCATPRHTYQ